MTDNQKLRCCLGIWTIKRQMYALYTFYQFKKTIVVGYYTIFLQIILPVKNCNLPLHYTILLHTLQNI